MGSIRRHLVLWTIAWLSCQIASLSALAFVDAAAQTAKNCIQAGPAEQCPMRGTEGEPCPMHRGVHTDARGQNESCTLRSTTAGAATLLGAVFSVPAVMPAAAFASPMPAAMSVASPRASLAAVSVLLDTPPPRA